MLGLTQKEIAERAGLSATALVNIETGVSDPKASTLTAIQADRHRWIQLEPGLPGRAVGPGRA